MSTKDMNLHEKILKIADMAGVLQRTKDGFGYKYVPEEDIQAKVTAGLQKYRVMLYENFVPGTLEVIPYHYEKYDAKIKGIKPVNEIIVKAETRYLWVNVDNPEEKVETFWGFVGQMEDAAQAMGAGLTYGNRYYLMKQLQLATTESDPDGYRSKQREAENYEEELARRVAAEELAKHVKKVVENGSKLISEGLDKNKMIEIVAKYNNGNGNPSSITSKEICESILAEFNSMAKKSKKGDKTE